MSFYKYIIKRGDRYSIVKNNEWFGTYSKITDALYERDRLVEVGWDWDNLMALEETDNIYEKMTLPPFFHDFTYISKRSQGYKVYKKSEYMGKFTRREDAEEFANKIGGRITKISERYMIRKSINGEPKWFGAYETLEEAQKVRDKLIKNGWKK